MPKILLFALSILLIGYAFLGRSFAYLGFPPIYVGEIVFALGVLTLISNKRWFHFLRLGTTKWLILFMSWCAFRTIPYIKVWGIDALRDGASWGYGFFALATAFVLVELIAFQKVIVWYRNWMLVFALWAPISIILSITMADKIPMLPWGQSGEIALFALKSGDVAVHLVGILAYVLILQPIYSIPSRRSLLIMVGWFISFVFVAFTGRAAFLTVSTAALFLFFTANPRTLFKWFASATLLISLAIIFNVKINTGGEREISFEQLSVNIRSIFGKVENFPGEGTKVWRLLWWQTIINYTVRGEYFWTGKGFGINLADDDGFQVTEDHSLRSPHNGHLTFLARAGVPGLILWAGLQISYFLSLFSCYRRWKQKGCYIESRLCLWVLTYWLAFMVTGAFDVFLEGPQGGIWFWSIIGSGVGIIYAERQQVYFKQRSELS